VSSRFFFTPALSVAVGATIPDTGTAGHPHYISFAQKYGLRNEERVKSKGSKSVSIDLPSITT
jgi:hypothetical protein